MSRNSFGFSIINSQIYRFSNLGKSLVKTLSDLEKEGTITSTQKESILKTFDKVYFRKEIILVENDRGV